MPPADVPASSKWKPISDIEGDPNALSDGELKALKRVWDAQKASLLDPSALRQFDDRLRRQWSIETGIIERVFTLDRGVTQTLIERGISASLIPPGATDRAPALVAQVIQDHYDALEGIFEFVKGQRPLTAGYVKELHAALLRSQSVYTVVDQFGHISERPLEKGQYKSTPTSPSRPDAFLRQYCPPEHVASEMDRLVDLHNQHEGADVPVEVKAAWLHHRFTQIHPFPDGNGRVARAIASIVFIQAGWFPLVIDRDDWHRYIAALEEADSGDLRRLAALFVRAQRNAVIQAAAVGYEIDPPASIQEEIAAARNRLKLRIGSLAKWLPATVVAEHLAGLTQRRLNRVSADLTRELRTLGATFSFSAGRDLTRVGPQILEVVSKAGHSADLDAYHAMEVLRLSTGAAATLRVFFYALGPAFHGMVGVTAWLETQGTSAPIDTFQVNYEDTAEDAEFRYSPWLERVIQEALREWRHTL